MTKGMTAALLVTAASTLVAPSVLASEGPVMRVEVPFAFTAGDRQLPAGEYDIVKAPSSRVVRICSSDRKHQASLFYIPALSSLAAGAELEFRAHGDRRVLKLIRTANGFGAEIPESQLERGAAGGGPVERGAGMR
jgi:hypothetical protein